MEFQLGTSPLRVNASVLEEGRVLGLWSVDESGLPSGPPRPYTPDALLAGACASALPGGVAQPFRARTGRAAARGREHHLERGYRIGTSGYLETTTRNAPVRIHMDDGPNSRDWQIVVSRRPRKLWIEEMDGLEIKGSTAVFSAVP